MYIPSGRQSADDHWHRIASVGWYSRLAVWMSPHCFQGWTASAQLCHSRDVVLELLIECWRQCIRASQQSSSTLCSGSAGILVGILYQDIVECTACRLRIRLDRSRFSSIRMVRGSSGETHIGSRNRTVVCSRKKRGTVSLRTIATQRAMSSIPYLRLGEIFHERLTRCTQNNECWAGMENKKNQLRKIIPRRTQQRSCSIYWELLLLTRYQSVLAVMIPLESMAN